MSIHTGPGFDYPPPLCYTKKMPRICTFTTVLVLLVSLLAFAADAPELPRPLQLASTALDTTLQSWQWRPSGGEWRSIQPGRSIDSAEFELRTRTAVARVSQGFVVAGTPVELDLEFRSAGKSHVTVQVNGHNFDPIAVDGGNGTAREVKTRLHLTDTVHPREWSIHIHVRNRGFLPPRGDPWPPRRKPAKEAGMSFHLQRAAFHYPAAAQTAKTLKNWTDSLYTAQRLVHPDLRRFTFTGHPYAIPDGRGLKPRVRTRLEQALKKALDAFDGEALESGNTTRLLQSIRTSLGHCGPLREYARSFEVRLIGNAHIDIAWLWRMRETVQVARNTFRTVLENIHEYPELHYAQSQALAYQWIEDNYPDLFAKIGQAIRAGRWEVVGGMWVEPDCNLISGESWVRQILYGKRYFRERFGVDVTTGWNVDSFGYNHNMPQFFSKSGIQRFVTQKIWWNDTTVFPHYVFWWEGVDGTRLLSYFPPAGYTSRVRLNRVVDQIARYQATTGLRKSLILYGIGDHGGGPNREILDRVRGYAGLSIAPSFIHSRSKEFLDGLPREMGNRIPTWRDELYLEYHRGTFTTQAAVKRANRELESRLGSSEKWAALAQQAGNDYPAARLEQAWKTVLTNQFHDILPGSSITPVYRDAAEAYAGVRRNLDRLDGQSLAALCARISTKQLQGRPVVVFNPLAWERNDVVRLKLGENPPRHPGILDHGGQSLPVEILENEWGEPETLVFIARNVPSLGHRCYSLVSLPAAPAALSQPTGSPLMENKFLRVQVDPKNGRITSLVHKATGREFVPQNATLNALEIHEDRPEDWDAWNIGYTGRRWSLDRADKVEGVSRTPVRRVIRVHSSFLGLSKARRGPTEEFPSSFFTQEISLWDGLDRLDIHSRADWWEDHMMLKAAFPVAVNSDTASYEIPFAAIRRSTRRDTLARKARFEVPALRWADLSDDSGGLSLLNDGKYGHDIHENTMRISLLRAPTWPDPLADRGRHAFTYSLYPHAGSWMAANTMHRGRELNSPLQAVFTDHHDGELPPVYSHIRLEPSAVILETVKAAEDGKALILRVFNGSNHRETTTLTFFTPPRKVLETDLMETPIRTLKAFGPKLPLELGPFEIMTLKIICRPPDASGEKIQ